MLKKESNEIGQPARKRVHWDESVKGNERMPGPKRKRLEYTKRETKTSRPKLSISLVKKHFKEGTYGQLEEILSMHSSASVTKLFTLNDYDLFRLAAIANDVEALNLIINNVSKETAHNMLHYANMSQLDIFLYHSWALEELNQLDHLKRIEGFKIFLKIDYEAVQKAFYDFDAKITTKYFAIKESLKNDFTLALTQLQKEGDINALKVEEKSIEESLNPLQNDLLKHLDTSINGEKLALYSSSGHAAFNDSMAADSKDISNLIETAKKAGASPNFVNTSYKVL